MEKEIRIENGSLMIPVKYAKFLTSMVIKIEGTAESRKEMLVFGDKEIALDTPWYRVCITF